MSFRTALGTGLGVLALAASALLPTTAAAAAAPVGEACAPGEGVTVVADFRPVLDQVEIACAVGVQADYSATLTAAGFTFTEEFGFLNSLNETAATDAGGTYFWAFLTSTGNGRPGGSPSADWTFAQVGLAGGPVPVDDAVLLQLQDYTAAAPEIPVPLSSLPAYRGGDVTVDPPQYPAAADGNAVAAAGWLGRQLEAGDDVLAGANGTDWGLTQDAVIALAAAGVGKDQIDATVAALLDSGEEFIGPLDDPQTFPEVESAPYATAVAKMAFTLQVAGPDPTAFPAGEGTRNLITELRAAENADGSFGSGDFPFAHSLALLSLVRTEGGPSDSSIGWLQQQQCRVEGDPNVGAYGLGRCGGVDVDGTALAIQSLLATGVPATDPSIADAVEWLAAQQLVSGGLPAGSGAINTNSTGLGGQALLGVGGSAAGALAAGFIGSLQVSCDTVLGAEPLVPKNVGAIAYDIDSWDLAAEFGIEEPDVDQWQRATSQALLGLGLPTFDDITAAGAAPDLPAVPDCTAPTTPVTPTTPTSPTDNPAVLAVSLSANQVVVGGTVDVTVSGAVPGSQVRVELHSVPAFLGALTIGDDGTAVGTVTIPADTTAGTHQIVVLSDTATATAELQVLAAGGSTTTPTTSTTAPVLSATGVSDATAPTALVGLLLLLGGGLVLVAVRRRPALGRHHG